MHPSSQSKTKTIQGSLPVIDSGQDVQETNERRHIHLRQLLPPTNVIDHLRTKITNKKGSDKTSPPQSLITTSAPNEPVNRKSLKSIMSNEATKSHENSASSLPPMESNVKQNGPQIVENNQVEVASSINNVNDENITIKEIVEKNRTSSFNESEQEESLAIDRDQLKKRKKGKRSNRVTPRQKTRISHKSQLSSLDDSQQDSISENKVSKQKRHIIRSWPFQLRDEDFWELFQDLPSEEQLIVCKVFFKSNMN
ncbi:unnamed protein product [Didymodactylos carnosus]|uniref:Uncharacterized protein n=1 Tax=Didymodactylos carnosus TaxID=1234261 RepID=A0A815RNL5_9BILA|nr:unnamed protein product [Didymodactylos carnosus]CAF1478213.1 unnamed protein product [Didymodactylos carnosus]CAF4135884.1 unnamed protein product [Didymodactylos carnosus]CAF4343809.1 unnamed protein product [Didymodactylos carnosus]